MFNGLSNSKKKMFLGIANGHITYRAGKDAEPQNFENLDGKIAGITPRDANINGQVMKLYDISITDNNGEEAVLSVIADGGVARGLILALANIPDFKKPVRIRAYNQVDGERSYTNTMVYQDGNKVPWIIKMEDLPKGVPVMVNGRPFVSNGKPQYDFSERNAVIDEYVKKINDAIAAVSTDGGGSVDFEEDDLPATSM